MVEPNNMDLEINVNSYDFPAVLWVKHENPSQWKAVLPQIGFTLYAIEQAGDYWLAFVEINKEKFVLRGGPNMPDSLEDGWPLGFSTLKEAQEAAEMMTLQVTVQAFTLLLNQHGYRKFGPKSIAELKSITDFQKKVSDNQERSETRNE